MPSPSRGAAAAQVTAAAVSYETDAYLDKKRGGGQWKARRNGLPITVAYLVPGCPDVPPDGMPVRRYAGTGHDQIPLPEFAGRGACDCGAKNCPAKSSPAARKETSNAV